MLPFPLAFFILSLLEAVGLLWLGSLVLDSGLKRAF